MSSKLIILLTLIACTSCQMLLPQTTVKTSSLNDNWQFRAVGDTAWHKASVPGNVQADLVALKLIPEPFFRRNEDTVQWVAEKDWEYRRNFTLEQLDPHTELVFDGLDTYAEVYLNDTLLLNANNMFRSWRVDISKQAHVGDNTLRVIFRAPEKIGEAAEQALGFTLPVKVRPFTRKAAFNYGWDWAPKLVTMGIWKAVSLRTWSGFYQDNVFYKTEQLTGSGTAVTATVRVRTEVESEEEGEATWTIKSSNLPDSTWTQLVALKKGHNVFEQVLTLNQAKLWWSNGLGEAYLYNFESSLVNSATRHTHTKTQAVGLRTIELVQDKDEVGKSFYFRLNGIPVFAKGANYVPQNSLQSRVTEVNYRQIIADTRLANMNMLRVWGGGIYENDLFYELCDQNGILIWQDFMFACAMYPGDDAFLENVRQEGIEQIKRLRQHACLALWCGNNENYEAWHGWGWTEQYNKSQTQIIEAAYDTLFHKLLPRLVGEFDEGKAYWESSPSYGRFDRRSQREGDSHYWGVWHDAEPFETYIDRVPRFMSEFGFQSFPAWTTIESFTDSTDRSLTSKVMNVHQKHPRGNELINAYMKTYHRDTKDFENFVYVSQLLQADAMRVGIEAHRRAMPYCMGSLYWQLNDTWPAASWAGRDVDGRWKALHYTAQKAFAPVLISPIVKAGQLDITVVSDKLQPLKGTLTIDCVDFEGKVLSSQSTPYDLPANTSKLCFSQALTSVQAAKDAKNSCLRIRMQGDEEQTILFYSVASKDLDLPKEVLTKIRCESGSSPDEKLVIVESPSFIKNLYLESPSLGNFDTNFIDLLPNTSVTFKFKALNGQALPDNDTFLKQLRRHDLAASYKAKAWWQFWK